MRCTCLRFGRDGSCLTLERCFTVSPMWASPSTPSPARSRMLSSAGLPKVGSGLRATEVTFAFTIPRSSRASGPPEAYRPSRAGALPGGEGHDPEYHAKGGEEATGQAFLGQQAAAQERPDQDADLAGGGDAADRREDQRREDQQVRDGAQHGHTQGFGPALPPGGPDLPPPPQRDRQEDDGLHQQGPPVVQDGREQEVADGVLVPEGVGGDKGAGQQPEYHPEPPLGGRPPPPTPPVGPQEDPRDHEEDAGPGDRPSPLPEGEDRGPAREQRPRAPRQRVDDR